MKKTAKNRINFTKNTLINLPIPSQSRAIYYDTNEDKLYLQITPAGTKTFYFVIITILIINLCKIYAKNGDYMLINFKFSNYKSFKDEAEFSMEPLTNNGSISNAVETGYKKAPYVYRTSAIFGANASGTLLI